MALVKFRRGYRLDVRGGGYRDLHPGDMYELSTAQAERLIEQGIAEALTPLTLSDADAAHVCLLTPIDGEARVLAMSPAMHVMVVDGAGILDVWRAIADAMDEQDAARQIVWWDGNMPLTAGRLRDGVSAVETWDAALPMADYRVLAMDVGGEADRALTLDVIGDLRVPTYHVGMAFLANNARTRVLVDACIDEMQDDAERHGGLALLRALWRTEARVLPLPPAWGGVKG